MTVGSEGIVSRSLPQRYADSLARVPRFGTYGDTKAELVTPCLYSLADEGQYFTAMNASPGTAANYAIQATFSSTVAMFSFYNTDTAGSTAKRIYLDHIRIIQGSTVPASATDAHLVVTLDSTSRASSGTALTVHSANMDVSTTSVAAVRYTPTVAAASSSVRQVARSCIRSVIPVANDEWVLRFGSLEGSGALSLGGTVAQRMIVPLPPVVIGPEDTALVHLWFTSNAATAGQYEYSMGWWER